MPEVRLSRLTKTFSHDVTAVCDLELTIGDGELLVLVGPSGCGKSTTLRLIAGLEQPTRGTIHFNRQDVTTMPPAKRRVGMVFQGENHFSHLTVGDNLAVGLRLRRTPAGVVRERVTDTSQRLGLESLLDRWPQDLSGGEQQRVALGRVLAGRTPVCLLDEPLSNVDPAQRGELRAAVRTLHNQTQATLIYVTHDQVEAMTLGQRIAIMREGRLQQVGTPPQIYRSPSNTFVARFIGAPPMNLFSACVHAGSLQGLNQTIAAVAAPDGPVVIGIRPERLTRSSAGPVRLHGVIQTVEYLGADQIIHVIQEQHAFLARLPAQNTYRTGDGVQLSCDVSDVHLFAADASGQFLGTAATPRDEAWS